MTEYHHDIEKYLKGELTSAERHALEKKALSDPLLAEALEGAEQIDAVVFTNDVDELNKKITGHKAHSIWIWPLRIAAGVVILIASTYIVWQAFEPQPATKQLAFEQKNKPDPTPQPSASDSDLKEQEDTTKSDEKVTAGSSLTTKDKAQSTLIAESQAKPVVVTSGSAGEVVPSSSKADEDVSIAKSADQKVAAEDESIVEDRLEEIQRAKKIAVATDDQRKETAAPVSRADRSSRITIAYKKIISGRVTASEDGSGLSGVNVVIKGTTIGTVTDGTGNYQIEITNPNPVLSYSAIGLQNQEVTPGDRTEVDVALRMDVTQLSEIAVTGPNQGNGTSSIPNVNFAHPVNGYQTFKHYLQKNIQYPQQAKINKIEGKVTVEFTVEDNGALTNFRVISGIGNGCDEELIRLIKQGPDWIPTKKDGVPLPDKARVYLKFVLPR